MRKIKFHLTTGYCGEDAEIVEAFDDDVTSEQLDDYAWHYAVDNAAAYGVYPMTDLDNLTDEEIADENLDNYSDNIEGWWEDVEDDAWIFPTSEKP